MQLLLVVGVVCTVFASGAWGKRECLTVRGQVQCPVNTQKHKYVKVQLVDDNYLRDKVVDKAWTSESGHFVLSGCVDETFDGQFRIYNHCRQEQEAQKWIHKIPSSYKTLTEYNMGVIDLASPDNAKFPERDRSTYNKPLAMPCLEQ